MNHCTGSRNQHMHSAADLGGHTGLDDCVKIACGAKDTDINPSVQYLLVELWEVVAVNIASVGLAAAGSLTIAYPLDYARTHLASDVGSWKEDLRWIVRLLEESCLVYRSVASCTTVMLYRRMSAPRWRSSTRGAPFSSRTGRPQSSSAGFVFGPPRWRQRRPGRSSLDCCKIDAGEARGCASGSFPFWCHAPSDVCRRRRWIRTVDRWSPRGVSACASQHATPQVAFSQFSACVQFSRN